jgi:hypothetical protein
MHFFHFLYVGVYADAYLSALWNYLHRYQDTEVHMQTLVQVYM